MKFTLTSRKDFPVETTNKLITILHYLAIECGSYSKTPRELRTCHLCKSCMGAEILDGKQFMHELDLYSDKRAKFIVSLDMHLIFKHKESQPTYAPIQTLTTKRSNQII